MSRYADDTEMFIYVLQCANRRGGGLTGQNQERATRDARARNSFSCRKVANTQFINSTQHSNMDHRRAMAARRLQELADAIGRFQRRLDDQEYEQEFEQEMMTEMVEDYSSEEIIMPNASASDTDFKTRSAAAARRLNQLADRIRTGTLSSSSQYASTMGKNEESPDDQPYLPLDDARAARLKAKLDAMKRPAGRHGQISRVRYDIERAKEQRQRLNRLDDSAMMTTTSQQAHSAKVFKDMKGLSIHSDLTADTFSSMTKRITANELLLRARKRSMTPAHEEVYPLPSVAIAARLGIIA